MIFATDNHILILTYGSSNCLQLGKNYSFFFIIIWKSDESDEKPSTPQLGKHIPMFSDVSKAHESASVVALFIIFPQKYLTDLCS